VKFRVETSGQFTVIQGIMKSLVTDRTGRFAPLKALALACLAGPALLLAWRVLAGDLGPLPYKEALHVTGDWAVRFLVATLALTPLQRIGNWPKLALIRRMLGVGTFCYAALHFLLTVANLNFQLGFIASEIALRIYLTIGFAALLGLSALAATSTDAMVRRLGAGWKRLHRLVYGIAVLALIHFFLQSKIDVSKATLYAGLFISLMILRLAIRRRMPLTPLRLAGLGVLGGLATAVLEFSWYGLATGIDPWRIAKANLMLTHGLRPAVMVTLAGLALALIPVAQSLWRGRPATARTRAA
jgi:methionine sulfoxide reductase heme-binding subunit